MVATNRMVHAARASVTTSPVDVTRCVTREQTPTLTAWGPMALLVYFWHTRELRDGLLWAHDFQ
jgi:hypothetical protein